MINFFMREITNWKSLYGSLLFCIFLFSAGASRAASNDIIVIGYTGESSYLTEAATKNTVPVEEFMRIFPTDSLVVGQDDKVILLHAATGMKQTWNGPVTVSVAAMTEKPDETSSSVTTKELPSAVAEEAREILHSRAGGFILRGAGTKKKERTLSEEKYQQLKTLLQDL